MLMLAGCNLLGLVFLGEGGAVKAASRRCPCSGEELCGCGEACKCGAEKKSPAAKGRCPCSGEEFCRCGEACKCGAEKKKNV